MLATPAAAFKPTDGLPPLVPRSVLFGNPEKASPLLSPDGKYLAFRAARDGVMNVWVRAIGENNEAAAAVPVTHDTTRPIRSYFWAENSKHIIYLQDAGGDENFHVFGVDVERPETSAVDLTPFPGVRASPIATDPNQPDVLLVAMNQRDPQVMDVWRISLSSGERTPVAENPGNIVGWAADHDLRVRAAITRHADGASDILVRDNESSGDWRTLISFPFGETGGPVAFSKGNQSLYLLSNKNANTLGLYLADLRTGQTALVCDRSDVDLGGTLFHPTRHTLQAVSYTRARREWVALDESVAGDLAFLQTVAEGDFAVESRDNADAIWVVSYVKSDGSPEYFLYDRTAKQVTKLFSAQPALDAFELAKTVPLDIIARDGLILPSYLTLPVGVPDENLPVVLLVHGGPWTRDS